VRGSASPHRSSFQKAEVKSFQNVDKPIVTGADESGAEEIHMSRLSWFKDEDADDAIAMSRLHVEVPNTTDPTDPPPQEPDPGPMKAR
jgi:hypothetical protein